jgi:hypothetical protein
MKTAIGGLAALLFVAAWPAYAADSGARTYQSASCTDRNANPDNCVIQDGPPRRSAFGNPPPVVQPTPPKPAQPPAGAAGNPVTVLGGGNSK